MRLTSTQDIYIVLIFKILHTESYFYCYICNAYQLLMLQIQIILKNKPFGVDAISLIGN